MMRSLSHWGMFDVPGERDSFYLACLFEEQLEKLLFTTEQLILKIDHGSTVSPYIRLAAYAVEHMRDALAKYGRAQRDRSNAPKVFDALF